MASTTTTEAATSTTLVASDFDPPCAPSTTPASTAVDDPSLGTFGPLGARPALEVGLPTLPALAGNEPNRQSPAVYAARVPGGVLLALGPNSYSSATDAIVSVVGFDGAKRWVGCLAGALTGAFVADPSRATTALVAMNARVEGDEWTTDYHLLSLATGKSEAAASALAHLTVAASAGDQLLFTHQPTTALGPDALVLYDLTTNTAVDLPVPPEVTSTWGFDDRADPIMFGDHNEVVALFRDGAWLTDPSAIDAALPPVVAFAFDAPRGLTGRDASGTVRWTNAALTDPGFEGEALAVDGAITIADVCTKPGDVCSVLELAGVVSATGDIAWTLPGFRSVTAIGDGHALVTDGPAIDPRSNEAPAPGWMMIDSRTGTPVAGQRWSDPDAFKQGCCGESENLGVTRLGGVVVALDYDKLRIWLPQPLTPATTHRLSLP